MKQWQIGEIRNGYEVLPKERRKKVLLLCDDIRTHSGIATMGREIIFQTCHHFNWVNLGALIKHPESGKQIDLSQSTSDVTGVPDLDIKIYPNDGYGNPDLLRLLMTRESPDAIMHYTDPRFWAWLYQMENEIRQTTPILYYNIWDDLPYPKYNKQAYASSDLIMNISKQTLNIVKNVLGDNNVHEIYRDGNVNRTKKPDFVDAPVRVSYVPHGINSETFYPVDKTDSKYMAFKDTVLKSKDYDFIILYNNRNIRRKMPTDLMMVYKFFCEEIGEEKAKKCLLLYKTTPIDNNGTDLPTCKKDLGLENLNVSFLHQSLTPETMNYLYNMVDVTIGISSAEGFGLATAESVMAGTPIIVNAIGGLQDQCRFENENGDWIGFNTNHPTNSDKRYTKCGSWAFPVWPQLNMVGSPPTPYIYDSRAGIADIWTQLMKVYELDWIERRTFALEGRAWMMTEECGMSAKEMGRRVINDITYTMKLWKPRERMCIVKATHKGIPSKTGVYNPIKKEWE